MLNGRIKRTGTNRKTSGDGRLLFVLIGVAVILILLIVIVVRKTNLRKQEIAESRSAALVIQQMQEEQESIEASIAASEAEAAKYTLKECDDPEITALVKDYFRYRLEGDAENLYRLFGMDTEGVADSEYAEKLNAQKAWVRSFDDIEIYLIPGESDDEKLGIVKYKINFRRVNSKAPCIMYFYVSRDEDGNWVLRDDLVKETREKIAEEFEKSGLQSVIDQNTAELKEALENDSSLALIYTSFLNGEIYSDSNLDPDRDPEIDLFTDPQDSVLVGEE